MYFPDLSSYSYSLRVPLPGVLNVGWLDQSMPFRKGVVPDSLSDRLRDWFRVGRVNQMRGIYQCNLCEVPKWPLPPLDGQKWILPPLEDNPSIIVEGRKWFLGSWEIWIPSLNEKIFACPALVIHYVAVHGYTPPEEFIASVMTDKAIQDWNAEAEFERRTRVGLR